MSEDYRNGGNADFPYEDIVNMQYPFSTRHPRMSAEGRAAQFAPFSALTGHDEAIAETARLTSDCPELSADEQQELSRRLNHILSLSDRPKVDITYFRPDGRKEGGSLVTVRASIRKAEPALNLLTLADGSEIPLDALIAIQSPIF